MKIVAVDMDGVLCENPSNKDFSDSVLINLKPIQENIDKVNKLFEVGTFIFVWTARRKSYESITRHWLETHGVLFHSIVCGKLWANAYIDDKNTTFEAFMQENGIT